MWIVFDDELEGSVCVLDQTVYLKKRISVWVCWKSFVFRTFIKKCYYTHCWDRCTSSGEMLWTGMPLTSRTRSPVWTEESRSGLSPGSKLKQSYNSERVVQQLIRPIGLICVLKLILVSSQVWISNMSKIYLRSTVFFILKFALILIKINILKSTISTLTQNCIISIGVLLRWVTPTLSVQPRWAWAVLQGRQTKLSASRSLVPAATYLTEADISAKGVSTDCSIRGLKTHAHHTFQIFFSCSQFLHLFLSWYITKIQNLLLWQTVKRFQGLIKSRHGDAFWVY